MTTIDADDYADADDDDDDDDHDDGDGDDDGDDDGLDNDDGLGAVSDTCSGKASNAAKFCDIFRRYDRPFSPGVRRLRPRQRPKQLPRPRAAESH